MTLGPIDDSPLDLLPAHALGSVDDSLLDLLPASALSSDGDSIVDFIPADSYAAIDETPVDYLVPSNSALFSGLLDLTPSYAQSAVFFGLALANRSAYRAIHGTQIADAPDGITTDHLIAPALPSNVQGRRKMEDTFIDDVAANSMFVDGAIDTVFATQKIEEGAIPLAKLQQGTIERLANPDKNKFVAAPTSGNGADTGLFVVGSPTPGGYVAVLVNGLFREVGDGVTTKDCYFSPDGTIIRAYGAVQTGDKLYWNGVIAGADLQTTDRVDFLYVYTSF